MFQSLEKSKDPFGKNALRFVQSVLTPVEDLLDFRQALTRELFTLPELIDDVSSAKPKDFTWQWVPGTPVNIPKAF